MNIQVPHQEESVSCSGVRMERDVLFDTLHVRGVGGVARIARAGVLDGND